MFATRKKATSLLAALYVTAMITTALPSVADEIDVAEPESRLDYDRHNAPKGIRLMMFLQVYSMDDPRTEGMIEARLHSMGIKEGDIETLAVYFEQLYRQIKLDIAEGHWKSACYHGASELTGDELGALFNSFDDVRFETYESYVSIVEEFLAGLGYSDFSARLENEITGFGVHSMEFKAQVIGRDHEYQDLRASMCERLSHSSR